MAFVLYGSLLMSIGFYLQSVGVRAINSISLVLKGSPLTGGIRLFIRIPLNISRWTEYHFIS